MKKDTFKKWQSSWKCVTKILNLVEGLENKVEEISWKVQSCKVGVKQV